MPSVAVRRMLKAAHSPKARRRAQATLRKLYAYKKRQGISWRQKLTPTQYQKAVGRKPRPWSHVTEEGQRRFKASTRTVQGTMPVAAILGAKPPKPGAHSAQRRYITAQRITLAQEVVRLSDRLTRKSGGAALAHDLIGMINRLLNGGA